MNQVNSEKDINLWNTCDLYKTKNKLKPNHLQGPVTHHEAK
jgi:hypothetical protein